MRYILLLLIASCYLLSSCDDQEIGFLSVEYAKYNPDTLFVAKEVTDQRQIDMNIPWVSTQMEGVEGTQPITLSIAEVKSTSAFDKEQFLSDVNVRGNGIFEVALKHQIPSGRYLISLEAKNEGHTKLIPDIFTVIVE